MFISWMTIKLFVSSIVASITLYLANFVLCLLWMLLYIHITFVGAISFTVNIADYVYVLTLSDIMGFYYGTRWLMMYVLLIHLRCLKIISNLTCFSKAKKVYFIFLFFFLCQLFFNIMFTSLVSLNFSSNCLCIWEFSYISLGFWGFPVVLILSLLSICLWCNWCVVSQQNKYLLTYLLIPICSIFMQGVTCIDQTCF